MPGLYLHIPFCEHKCVYCDFYSIAPQDSPLKHERLVGRFLRALEKEIDHVSRDNRFQQEYDTIFFGGGTPSLLEPSKIEAILNRLAARFAIRPDAEITLETNPGTVDLEKLRAFRAAGVNRISMGIQSFHDDDLRFLSRIHSAETAKECVRNAFDAGFDNVSFDLIFALPSQTLERWRSNLHQAMELAPTHISCYSLIVEPHTPLYRMVQAKQVTPVDVETDAAMYELTIAYLASQGYEQYEVSNFARPGYKSRHNSAYWTHDNYLGFGPSAHSFWKSEVGSGSSKRWWNLANVVGYAERLESAKLPIAGEEELTTAQLLEEEIFLGLRSEGIDVAGFRKRYDTDFLTKFEANVEEILHSKLATFDGHRLRLTAKGYAVCDEICCSFQ